MVPPEIISRHKRGANLNDADRSSFEHFVKKKPDFQSKIIDDNTDTIPQAITSSKLHSEVKIYRIRRVYPIRESVQTGRAERSDACTLTFFRYGRARVIATNKMLSARSFEQARAPGGPGGNIGWKVVQRQCCTD
ncbi:hypothetical protein HW555_007788 [Spodoptera exigua]|uniref:Uncharacterized protein n=1 Tax=Spodoptera exigua TaxID=7107 RepID=A0A835L3B8_SPOEX|nr:hypothetical protein HW555_007788 [Spodoptera exigua]